MLYRQLAPHHSLPTGIGDMTSKLKNKTIVLKAPHHSLPTGIGDPTGRLDMFAGLLLPAPHHSLPTGIGDDLCVFFIVLSYLVWHPTTHCRQALATSLHSDFRCPLQKAPHHSLPTGIGDATDDGEGVVLKA